MSPEQNRRYWAEFNAAAKVLQSHGYSTAECEDWRAETTLKACGRAVSSRDLTNRDLDMMLAHFRAVTDPDDLDGQLRQEAAERARLIRGIEKDSLGDAWLRAVLVDIYGLMEPGAWRTLPPAELLKLRRRCANARRRTVPRALSESAAAEFRSHLE